MANSLGGISKTLGNLGGIFGGAGFNPASIIGSLGGPKFPAMPFPGLEGLLGQVLRGGGPSITGNASTGVPQAAPWVQQMQGGASGAPLIGGISNTQDYSILPILAALARYRMM